MNRILVALTLSATLATAANAGALSDPAIENDVVVADAAQTSSSSGLGVLLLMTAVVIVASVD